MVKRGDWILTREDLWAVPGAALTVLGLVLEFSSHFPVGSIVLFVGIVSNTICVFHRSRRELRRRDERPR